MCLHKEKMFYTLSRCTPEPVCSGLRTAEVHWTASYLSTEIKLQWDTCC